MVKRPKVNPHSLSQRDGPFKPHNNNNEENQRPLSCFEVVSPRFFTPTLVCQICGEPSGLIRERLRKQSIETSVETADKDQSIIGRS